MKQPTWHDLQIGHKNVDLHVVSQYHDTILYVNHHHIDLMAHQNRIIFLMEIAALEKPVHHSKSAKHHKKGVLYPSLIS